MNPERTSHPSAAQVETLIEFLEKKPSLAKGFSKNQSAKQEANKDWEQITIKLNSMGGGTVKTAKKWIKYWSDKKSAVKKKAAARAASRNRTGGGMVDLPELTNIEERIILLMGGEGFATGDRHLQPQPFDEPANDSPSILAPDAQDAQASGTSTNIPEIDDFLIVTLGTSVSQCRQQQHLPELAFARPSSSGLSTPTGVVINTEDTDLSLGHRGQSQLLDNLLNQETEVAATTTNPTRRIESHGVNIMSDMDRHLTPARNVSRRQQHLPEPTIGRPSGSGFSSPRRPRRRTRRNAQASPPSQRRTNLMDIAGKFLRLEQQRLDLDNRVVAIMEQNCKMDRLLLQATNAVGEGLKALANAIKQ